MSETLKVMKRRETGTPVSKKKNTIKLKKQQVQVKIKKKAYTNNFRKACGNKVNSGVIQQQRKEDGVSQKNIYIY